MDEKNEHKNVIKVIVPIIICLIIVIVGAFVVMKLVNDKSYEIEEVKKVSYFKIYENEKYGVIDVKGNILVQPIYSMIEIPNPSKDVFIAYKSSDAQGTENETEVLNSKNQKILTEYSRSNTINV